MRNEWTDLKLFLFLKNNLKSNNKGNGNNNNNNSSNNGQSLDNHEASRQINGTGKKNGNDKLDENSIKEIFKNKIQVTENELAEQGCSNSERSIFERKKLSIKPDYFLNTLKLKRVVSKCSESVKIKNYKKINRKKHSDLVVYKGNVKSKGFKLIIGIDVSGSISEKDLNTFISMLYGFKKKKQEINFDIIYWSDNDIKKNKTYFEDVQDIKEFAKKKVYSSGGTDISEFHKYLNERYKEPIEVINITDGYFNYNSNLNKNIIKYHFVLTEFISENFKNFYSDKKYDIVSLKQEK